MRQIITTLLLLYLFCACFGQGITNLVFRKKQLSKTSTLTDGLISFWKMDEESGTRYDCVDTNHFVEYRTVGFDTGMDGNAAKFEGNSSQELWYGTLVMPNTYYSNIHFYGEGVGFLLSLWYKDTGTYRYYLVNRGQSQVCFRIFVSPTVDIWSASINQDKYMYPDYSRATDFTHVAVWYNPDVDSAYTAINGVIAAVVYSTRTWANYNYDWVLGAQAPYPNGGYYFTGLIDDVGLWGRWPVYQDGWAMLDSLYNNGNGWRPE